jgi:hypothetical protein
MTPPSKTPVRGAAQTMGQALAQSATQLSVSGPGTIDFNALVAKVAARKSNGLTIAAASLDYSALFSAVCAEYKSFSGIERKARLASEVVEQIDKAIDAFKAEKLARFQEDLVSYRCFAAHKPGQSRFVKAETYPPGESAMPLKEQHLFCTIAINAAQKRLDKMVEKYADTDRVDKAKKALAKLEATMAAINKMMAETVQPE